MTWSSPPTLAGFWSFIRNGMGISALYLPDDSVWPGYAFNVAIALVNPQVQQAPGMAVMYSVMVYNLAADLLINWAQDVPDVYVPGTDPPIGYFANLRKEFGCFNFTAGVVSASNDEGSGVSLEVVEGLKNLTVTQLQNLKTPYGRTYLGYAQSTGSLWGLT